ncbi:FIG006442: Integral membrane protein [Caballeronia glathei]|jgi:drug/metabolite transporter (DMT)-like permease|uniref:Multidrug DMT transporter permease n=1 Tax=Caballeronia glathei TaxID=60547 RepID=A0A069PWP3_9BURK|nr:MULTISPECIES: DMT family transporter [Burkholderiaceae]KDR41786.1 multidrug DMT transporter permease [Caballeronia glathei]TCK43281.1 threonine/homoserine efflux transporter RhtA [Paraburkholderia sp. BL8N3]CDY78812.1 FIG006442: Integral membrane protein [Caballeronia glathei]
MQRGVVCGVMAGAIWGFIFLAPRLLPDFSPLLLSSGRYVMYGLVSLVVALPFAKKLAAKLTRADLVALVKLALVGNLLYYMLLATAVQMVGIAPSSLIVGILPVTVTLAGRRDHGAIDLRRLFWPLVLVIGGIVCINIDVFSDAGGSATSVLTKLGGLACAAGALAAWTWYAVVNARYLQANTHFNGNEWSVLWGIVTGVLGALLWVLVLLLPSGTVQAAVSTERWQMFWAVSLALAVGGSWLGNTLWNAAAKRLPLTLSGQMIAFETLFALLYAFVYDARLPRLPEILAIVLLLAGVSWSVRQHAVGKPASRAELEAPAH